MNSKVFFLVCICVIACKHAVSASWDQPQGYWMPGSQGASETICSNHRCVAYISPFTSKTHCHPCSTHVPPARELVGSLFLLWSVLPMTNFFLILDPNLPNSTPKRPLILVYRKGLQLFQGFQDGRVSHMLSIPDSIQTAYKTGDMICTEQSITVVTCHISTNTAWNYMNSHSRHLSRSNFSYTVMFTSCLRVCMINHVSQAIVYSALTNLNRASCYVLSFCHYLVSPHQKHYR